MIKEISQDALLTYPPENYKYIIVYFHIVDNKIIPIESSEKYNYENVYKNYFIFRQINWFYKNEVRRNADYFSKDTFKQEFSYFLFKYEIIKQLLIAVIDENNDFIDLSSEDDKEIINLILLDHAVTKYAESFTNKKLLNIDLDQLSKDVHNYFRYNMKKEAGQQTGFIKPQVPSAVILKTLSEQFSGMTINELINLDEDVLQMLQVVGEQQGISQFEKQHINEDISSIGKKSTQPQLKEPFVSPNKSISLRSMQSNKPQRPIVPLFDAKSK